MIMIMIISQNEPINMSVLNACNNDQGKKDILGIFSSILLQKVG